MWRVGRLRVLANAERIARCLRIAIAFLAISQAHAQSADVLTDGARVRIVRWQPARSVVNGAFVRRDSLSFVVATGGDRATLYSVPVADIGEVEVALAERTAGQAIRRGAGYGALLGFGITAALLAVGAVSDASHSCRDDFCISGVGLAAAGGIVVTVGTTLIGGMFGAANRTIWQSVPVKR
jgi:hypothetical protein